MSEGDARSTGWTREDVRFPSGGEECAGWLYRPVTGAPPPVVVMAHGFAGERRFGLEPFAERFAAEGFAVLLFDYRGFGESTGRPRELVDPFRHVADWKAAVAFARRLPGVDGDRIGLWGTSFSGGHVLVVAAGDPGIRAVTAQVPYVDPISTFRRVGLGHVARGAVYALRDLLRALTGRPPFEVPVVAEPGTFAVMNTPDALPGYGSLVPEGHPWRNACPARILLTMSCYRPMGKARRVRCPVLIVLAERDSLIDPAAVRRTAERIPGATVEALPVGHFDVYSGEPFERVVAAQAAFFGRHLA